MTRNHAWVQAHRGFESLSLRQLPFYLILTSIIFTTYAFAQAMNVDPFKWNNKYSNIIGTLGNPNFASAMMALEICLLTSFL